MSFQVNFNTHGNDLKAALEAVISEKDDTNWLIYAFDKGTYDLRVQATGDGGLEELNDEFSDGKVQFALAKVIDPNTELPKYVFIGWCGSGVPELRKAFFNSQLSDVSKFFKSFHVQINARDEADVEPSLIMKRVAESSGANYSVHKEGSKPQSRVTPVGSVYKKTEIPNIAAMQRESMTKENAPTAVGTNYKPVTTTPRKMEQRWNVATSQDSGAGAVRAERERFEKEVRDREIEKSRQVVPDRTFEKDQRRQQEEDARKQQQEEEARQYEQDQRRQQEEARRYEEDQRQQEEEQRRQEQERQQEESRYQQQLEEQRRQEEDAQRKQEEEERQHAQRQRDESEKQRQQEEQRRAQQEQQEKLRQKEEQRRRQQEENERREQEEHQRQQKEQEEKKRQEEAAALESQLSNTADRAVHAAGAAAATATHASNASQGVSAVVLFAYDASENNEMSLAEGEVVHQIDQVDEGWWFGVSEDGKKEGLFPANYVQILEVEATQEAAPAPPAPPAPPAAPSPPPQQQQEQQHTAVALYDYEAEEDNEISFKEGDVITQIEFVSDDWWQGVAANGKSLGLFPANYVEYKG